MAHSFITYIDESGDDGFTFRDPPLQKGSSEWFVVSAAIVEAERNLTTMRFINEAIKPIEKQRGCHIKHFSKLPHEQKIPILNQISRSTIRLTSVCINKRSITQEIFKKGWYLYFYSVRLLLERVSWFVRDNSFPTPGDGTTKLVFAHCKHLSYEKLQNYFGILEGPLWDENRVHWSAIDTQDIDVLQVHQNVGLKIADAASASIRAGFELTDYGYFEPTYTQILRPVIYARQGNYKSYGLKIFPAVPEIVQEQNNRYEWLNEFDMRNN